MNFPHSASPWRHILGAVLIAGSTLVAQAASPVFSPIPVLDPLHPADPPKIPVGKSLVVPIAASDADQEQLTFKVTSSSAKVPARIKTGNPILRIHVKRGDGTGAGDFEGDMEFQLFRDLTPNTAGYIAGFAQAGFYDNQIFHRIVPGFVAQGGDPAGTGNGYPSGSSTYIGLPFDFDSEFQPSLVFTGRGQLAMANSNGGYNRGTLDNPGNPLDFKIDLGDFSGTNQSQFFITFKTARVPADTTQFTGELNLDFLHTIFGQMIRGFDLLDKIETVQTNGSSKPTVDIKMGPVTVVPGTAEATLILGCTGPGLSTIAVTATDPAGHATVQTFTVLGVPDVINDPPIMKPIAPIFAAVGTRPSLSVQAVDLEFDYMQYAIASVSTTTNGSTTYQTSPGSTGVAAPTGNYTPRSTAGLQTMALGVVGFNDDGRLAVPTFATQSNPTAYFGALNAYNWQVAELVYGDKPARTAPAPVQGAPGVSLGTVVVGRILDVDSTGAAANFTAQINWGDGTAPVPAIVSRDTTGAAPNSYTVAGSHTYAKAGVYSIQVEGRGNNGAPAKFRSMAVISASPLRAIGQELTNVGASLSNRILATFTDANSAGRIADYLATIDWGDGLTSKGVIAKVGDGSFTVRGSHVFKDAEAYAVSVRVHKNAAAVSTDAIAWSTVTLGGFTPAPHVPPFPQAHIVGAWGSGPSKVVNTIKSPFVAANLQVQFQGSFDVLNSGNRDPGAFSLRFWLSPDAVLNATGANADISLPATGLFKVTAFPPGASGSFAVTITLPKGQSGGGKYLLAQMVYTDPTGDYEAVPKVIVAGPIDPAVLVFEQTTSATTEAGGTAEFKVVLDTQPTHDVTIDLVSSVPAEGTVSPAQLVFTSANWSTPRTVTVTGVDDTADDGNKTYKITLKAPVSDDPNYSGLAARDISFVNVDNDPQ